LIRGSKASLFLGTVLGKDTSIVLIAASAAFVVISFFYIYSLTTYSKIDVWDMQDRVSYTSFFETYVINKTVDHLIITLTTALWFALSLKHKARFAIATIYGIVALISALFNIEALLDAIAIFSLPIIGLLLIINMLLPNKFLISDRNLVISYFAIIGIGFSLLSLIISLQPIYFPGEELTEVRSIAYEIFLISTGLSPVLLILLILSLPVKIIIDESIASIRRLNKKFINSMALPKSQTRASIKFFFLLLFMLLSATMVIIPHQSTLNKDNKEVGVDTHYYAEEIKILMNSTSPADLFKDAFVTIQNGDRAFTLLFFLMMANIIHADNLSYAFDNVPIILGPSLVLVIYFLTRQLTSNDTAALLSAFLTAISFHNLVGIYAGSYANWLALIIGYLLIVFVLRSLKETNKLNVLLFLILLNTTLFTHIYTWSILAIGIGIFLLVLLKIKYYERRNVIMLLVVLSSSVFTDILRTILTGAYSGIGYDISPPLGAIVQLGPEQFSTRWGTIMDTTLSYLGSLFGNSIIYALCLYWLIRSKLRETSTIFIVSFLSIGIIPLFFGNWFVQARVFYDIPFQIPAAIALAYLYKRRNGPLILIAVSVWLTVLSIRAVANFYFIPPPS
jgi:hypothetical protein